MARLTAGRSAAHLRVASTDRLLCAGVLCTVVGAVLVYGGVTAPVQAGIEVAAVILSVGLVLRFARQQALPIHALKLALPLWTLVVLGAAQVLPLPVSLRAPLGGAPELSLRYPLVPALLPLSLNAGSTLAALHMLAAAAGLFTVSLIVVRPQTAAGVATALVGAGGVIAAASLWNFIESGSVFGEVPHATTDRVRGPFVNPDHFANWLAALVPLGLAGLPSHRGPTPSHAYRFTSAAALPVIAAALGLTFSRGGAFAALCGVAFFSFSVVRQRRTRALCGAAAAGLVVLAYAAWAAGPALAVRFLAMWHDPVADLRIPIWEAAGRAFLRAPLTGTGVGTFLEAARPFVAATVPSRLVIDYAHSEPLQLAVEMGAVGVLIAVCGLTRWLRAVVGARHAAPPASAALISHAAAAGVIALLAGSLFDFAVRLPAIGLLAVVLAALAVVAQREPEVPRRIGRRGVVVLVAVGPLLLAGGLVNAVMVYRASEAAATARVQRTAADWSMTADSLSAAAALQPRTARYHYELARLFAEAGHRAWTAGQDLRGLPLAAAASRGREAQALYVRAVNAYCDAIAGDRTNPAYRRDLGWVLANLAALEEAFTAAPFTPELLLDRLPRDAEPSDLAFGLYLDATGLEPRNAHLHYTLGLWALQHLQADAERGLLLTRSDPAPLEQVAVSALGRATVLEPALLADTVTEMLRRGAIYEDVRAVVPADREALWRLAHTLEVHDRQAWTDRLVAELAEEPPVTVAPQAAEELAIRIATRADRSTARATLGRMLAALPTAGAVAGALARVEWSLGDLGAAQRDFARAVAALPPSALRQRFESDLGMVLIDRGDLAAAAQHFATLLRARPEDPWAHLGSGMVSDRRGAWLEAAQAYQRARVLAATDDDLCYRLGLQYFRRGLYHQASVVWEHGVRVNPSSVTMHLGLARAYAKSLRREAALQHYREALRLREDGEVRVEVNSLLEKAPG